MHVRRLVCSIFAVAIGMSVFGASALAAGPEAPQISGTSVTEVTATSAKLNAQVNPGGAETTYHFDYGTIAAYGLSTPESVSVGFDNSEHPAVAAIQGLQPGTTYHYRVVATNSQSPAGGTLGPDQTFTTQIAGGGFALPDGRAYELVSPPQKDGAEVLGIGGAGLTPGGGDATQASQDGTGVTYITTAPVGAGQPGNLLSTQVLSKRDPGGWSSKNISIPHRFSNIYTYHLLEEGEEYRRFSPNLSSAAVVSPLTGFQPSLAPGLHQEVRGGLRGSEYLNEEIYLRNDISDTFQAVITSEPLPKIEFEGASPDLSHVVFEGPAGLDSRYPNGGNLYEWASGQIQLVDVLPNKIPASRAVLGSVFRYSELHKPLLSGAGHAISADGSRVVWVGEGGLFSRDMASGETVQIDAARGGSGPSGGGTFLAASSDGSRVFFADGNELTSGAHNGGLFMFDVATERLTDLTPGAPGEQTQHPEEVPPFFGANEDGTTVYKVSKAVLTLAPNSQGQVAVAGANNLYVLSETPVGSGSWNTMFITAGMEEGLSGRVINEAPLVSQTLRVSPNGRFLAFMSRQILTGYDNRDANSGEPDEEVYLYDAESTRLACASCNPTGARPVGEFDPYALPQLAMDPWHTWEGRWLAAAVPGWTPDGSETSTGYQPRFLSDSGRLFFDSADALVPRDIDGKEDVYEYEPAGIGNCQSSSYVQSAVDVLSPNADGCVGLVSGGTGTLDSAFFDASASGNDVFFTTSDGLVGNDQDGVSDMYDARVCTDFEPCLSSLASAPVCATTDSCRVAPSPQPGVFAAPASAMFAGAGNVPLTPRALATLKAKTKTATEQRKKKLARALKVCGKQRYRRAPCEARARAKYGKANTSGRRVK